MIANRDIKWVRTDELYHHGIKGQKWGVRRYQNADGTLTSAGKAHKKGMDTADTNHSSKGLMRGETIPPVHSIKKKDHIRAIDLMTQHIDADYEYVRSGVEQFTKPSAKSRTTINSAIAYAEKLHSYNKIKETANQCKKDIDGSHTISSTIHSRKKFEKVYGDYVNGNDHNKKEDRKEVIKIAQEYWNKNNYKTNKLQQSIINEYLASGKTKNDDPWAELPKELIDPYKNPDKVTWDEHSVRVKRK